MRIIPADQLPINADGSVFHLHLKPSQLATKIVMMGDPGRVPVVASFFDNIEFDLQNREFRSITGTYRGKRITALSHGIGCDNIDIVLNELDALVNIDLKNRTLKSDTCKLTIVRIGSSGGLQPSCPIGSFVVSKVSMGIDGLLYFYANSADFEDRNMQDQFILHTDWNTSLAKPYFVHSDKDLCQQIGFDMQQGITCSASGFYGPQGRHLRLALADPEQNEKLESFVFDGLQFLNYEMEGAALAGLAAMMGHSATTVCLIIANRHSNDMNTDYKDSLNDLIIKVLDRI
ncbi:purine nucleoside phosphorylase [Bacteroidales bacterium]|nr:purine nucleoside phosphorylase [Bacteroidales bacterium]